MDDSDSQQATLSGDPQTTLVNQKKTDEYDVDIGRGNGGRNNIRNTEVGEEGWLGNPFTMSNHTREAAVEKYREAFRERLEDDEFRAAVESLRGKTLACYCTPKACHGDVILAYLRHGEEALE